MDAQSRLFLILEDTDVEGELAGLLLNLGENGSRGFHLELIFDVGGVLVNAGAGLLGSRLPKIK